MACMENVVPMFAPSMAGIVCSRLIRPALTNPTSITVVALLWTSVPSAVPSPSPAQRLRVVRERTR